MSAPWSYGLPTSVEIGGTEFRIRSDYRVILDICTALDDAELTGTEKGVVALNIFYVDFEKIPECMYQEAIQKCLWFIGCGDDSPHKKAPKLVDWEKDYSYIISPINKVAGKEIRELEYLHWWTFIGYYYEIGDCIFAQIVRTRDMLAKGKKMDKADREWYERNRDLVHIEKKYTGAEKDTLAAWGVS